MKAGDLSLLQAEIYEKAKLFRYLIGSQDSVGSFSISFVFLTASSYFYFFLLNAMIANAVGTNSIKVMRKNFSLSSVAVRNPIKNRIPSNAGQSDSIIHLYALCHFQQHCASRVFCIKAHCGSDYGTNAEKCFSV